MGNEEDKFLKELGERLAQNRKIAEKSWVPRPLYGLASYLGFHSFRVLLIISWAMTVLLFWGWYPQLVELSKRLFLFE